MIFHPEQYDDPNQDQKEYPWHDFSKKYTNWAGDENIKRFGTRPWEFNVIGKLAKFKKSHVVLDIGGAHSFYLPFISSKVAQSFIIDGGTCSEHDNWYKSLFSIDEFIDGKFTVIRQNASSLPFRDNYFDVVFSVSAFEHFLNDDATLASREIYRVLKPDGLFLGTVDFHPFTEDPYEPYTGFHDPELTTFTYESFHSRIVNSAGWQLVGPEKRMDTSTWKDECMNIALFFVLKK